MALRVPTDNQSPRELKRQIELEREGQPFLVYRTDADELILAPLAGAGPITIGRHATAEISLPWDSEVSSLHAEMEGLGDQWLVIDDGLSRNGTFVNDERVVGRRHLRDRDLVRCGQTLILFRDPSEAGQTDTSIASGSPTARTTPTQRRILVALCRPLAEGTATTPATNRAIAEEVHLGIDTVKTHLRALFNAFGIRDLPQNEKRARLAELALRSGAVTPRDVTPP